MPGENPTRSSRIWTYSTLGPAPRPPSGTSIASAPSPEPGSSLMSPQRSGIASVSMPSSVGSARVGSASRQESSSLPASISAFVSVSADHRTSATAGSPSSIGSSRAQPDSRRIPRRSFARLMGTRRSARAVKPLAQQLVDELGVGLALGAPHDLPHEEAEEAGLAATVGRHLVGMFPDDGIDLCGEGLHVGDLLEAALGDDLGRRPTGLDHGGQDLLGRASGDDPLGLESQ